MKQSNCIMVLSMIEKIKNALENNNFGGAPRELLEVFDATVQDVNKEMFPGDSVSKVYDFDVQKDDIRQFQHAFTKWSGYVTAVMERAENCANKTNRDMEYLMSYLEAASLEDVETLLKENFMLVKKTEPQMYENLKAVYRRYQFFWGDLCPEEDVFDLIEQREGTLTEHTEDFRWLFAELSDNRSRKILYNILSNWITFKLDWLTGSIECVFSDYFDLDLIPDISENEVFVDLGGFVGDTVADFVNTYGTKYKKIYTYEINPENLAVLKEMVKDIPNVVIREHGVGEKDGLMHFDLLASSTTLGETGNQTVKVVSLDQDIAEPVTWIKMDIEGSEQSALRGCARHIREEKPKLTICTYHNNEDIWKIPRMIKEIHPEYRLYFRYNGRSVHPSEYVIFAL